jgi:predicted aspartyl protease
MSRATTAVNVAISSAFLFFFLAFTGAAAAKPKEFPSPAGVVPRSELQVRLYQGYLVVVEGSVGFLEHQNLLVDTGTSPSIVNASIIRALGLTTQPATLEAIDASFAATSAVLPTLEVGPIRVGSIPVMVHDFTSLEQRLGIPIAAVVGLDVLGQSSFRLDYAAKRLVFGPVVRQGISLPLGPTPLVTVDLMVGRQLTHVLVDTGAAGLVFFESRVGRNLPLEVSPILRQDSTLSGSIPSRLVRPGELLLGDRRLYLQKAFLVLDRGNRRRSYDGLLGVGAMGFKSIAFDFDSKRMYLQI